MNNLNDSSNTSNIDLKNGIRPQESVIARPIIIPPERMFEMTFPHLASIYFGIKDKLNRFKKHTTKQK